MSEVCAVIYVTGGTIVREERGLDEPVRDADAGSNESRDDEGAA